MITYDPAEVILGFEGFRASAYQDGAGIWTIGAGMTYWQGKRVTETYPGIVTREQVISQLNTNINQVRSEILSVVRVPLTQNQLCALISFVYNIGFGNFEESTMLRYLNQGKYQAAAGEFTIWDKISNVTSLGLYRRRQQEQAIFNQGANYG